MQNVLTLSLLENNELKTIGSKLFYMRRCCKITRKVASEKSGISERTIKSWERDEKTPRSSNILPLLELYKNLGIEADTNWVLDINSKTDENLANNNKIIDFFQARLNLVIYDENTFFKAYEFAKMKTSTNAKKPLKNFFDEILNEYLALIKK